MLLGFGNYKYFIIYQCIVIYVRYIYWLVIVLYVVNFTLLNTLIDHYV